MEPPTLRYQGNVDGTFRPSATIRHERFQPQTCRGTPSRLRRDLGEVQALGIPSSFLREDALPVQIQMAPMDSETILKRGQERLSTLSGVALYRYVVLNRELREHGHRVFNP